MVFQHFALWPHLTVLQNLMEPLFSAAPAESRSPRRALALLSKVGLLEKQNAFPQNCPRTEAARRHCASAGDATGLALFDEPTSALDPELVGEVLLVMRDLAREGRPW